MCKHAMLFLCVVELRSFWFNFIYKNLFYLLFFVCVSLFGSVSVV